MRGLLLGTLLITLVACSAHAQSGAIGVFPDPSASWCELVDASPGLLTAYVVHLFTPGSTAARFRVGQSGGATLIYLTDQPAFLYVDGNSQTGVTVCYNQCLSSPILLMSILYFGTGTSAVCSYIEVLAHPDAPSGQIEVVNCTDDILPPGGWVTPINNDGTCPCYATQSETKEGAQPADTFPFCATIPTERNSWGTIKALYRE